MMDTHAYVYVRMKLGMEPNPPCYTCVWYIVIVVVVMLMMLLMILWLLLLLVVVVEMV